MADTLGSTKPYSQYFTYSNGQLPPQVGGIISMEAGNTAGHVAVVKGVDILSDSKLVVTLIEQNATVKGNSGFDVNRTITFNKEGGIWVSASSTFIGSSVKTTVVGWVNSSNTSTEGSQDGRMGS